MADGAAASPRHAPLPGWLRFAYSLGSAPDAMINIAFNVFLLYYLTSICGLSPGLAGFAVAAGLVVDAFLDPWIGMRSDHCRSRWGRRLPFMVGATPVMVAGLATLFSLPRAEDPWILFVVVLLLCITIRISISCFVLPFLAVGAELSDDDAERSRIIAWRWAMATILALATVLLGFGVFFKGDHGIADAADYPRFALALGALILAMAACASFAVYRTLDRQYPPPDHDARSFGELLLELRQLLRSPTFRTIFLGCMLSSTGQSATQALSLHVYTFYWSLGGDQTQMPIVALMIGLILGAPLGAVMTRRLEHRTTILLGVVGLMVAQGVLPTLKLCGLLSLTGGALTAILSGAQLLAGMMTTVAMLALFAMATEAIDEHEHGYGVRIEALYFAGLILAGKAANGLGAFLSGAALQIIDFPTDTVGAGAAVAIPEQTTRLLGVVVGPGTAVLMAVTLVVLWRYPLDRRRHAAIMADLEKRKGRERDDEQSREPSSLATA
ncbi:MAG TPA: MFS transporter [Nevskiaceae bacterium]|nr:MFS transporter [Nevskiaceae bacterium]